MSNDIRHRGQRDVRELDRYLCERIDNDIPSIAQGNTPEVDQAYRMSQQPEDAAAEQGSQPPRKPGIAPEDIDIQRRDQKPHHAPVPPPDNPDAVLPGKPGEPSAPEPDGSVAPGPDHYISRTPYHR